MAETHCGWWKSLSSRRHHKVAAKVHACEAQSEARISAEHPPSSLESSSDKKNVMMEEAEEEQAPAPVLEPSVDGFTLL